MIWAERVKSLALRLPAGARKAIVGTGMLALVLGITYYYDFESRIDDIEENDRKLAALKESYLSKTKEAIKLDLYRQQLVEFEKKFSQSLAQLPGRYNNVFVDIMQAARARGLRVDHLDSGEGESIREFYAEGLGNVKVSGSFHNLGAFVNDLAELRGMVTLYDLKIAATPKSGVVTMDAAVAAHRYLDEEELAAQRKAARKKAKK